MSLFKIQKISQQIVEVISSIINSEVALIDHEFKVVAGTGIYEKKIGEYYGYKHIYNKVADLKKVVVISNPGSHNYCRRCNRFNNCPKLLELIMPVLIEDKLVGIISLIAYDEQQRDFLKRMEKDLLDFLVHIGDLFISKLVEQRMAVQARNLFDQLYLVFNSLETGIMATDAQGIITHVNNAVEGLINYKKSRVIGCHINEIFPDSGLIKVLHSGDNIRNKEIVYQVDDYSKRLILTANPVKNGVNIDGIVASIRGIHDLKKLLDDFKFDNNKSHFEEIIGECDNIKRIKEKAFRVANSSSSVLIRGESGTGKELFARAIHQESIRNQHNFIPINCAAIPGDLLESELFGYESGAFTGARRKGKPGKFELADQGTIFLDEIGDMTLSLQAKILKVIQDKKFFRIGGIKEINVDVRIISATNKNLERMIKENKFREDLFYRLNVIPLELPPLRERKDDIILLVQHFIAKYNKKLNKNIIAMTADTEFILMNYSWPGNVRELENVIEYAINMESGQYINTVNLPSRMISGGNNNHRTESLNLDKAINGLERELIVKALNKNGWDTEGKMKAAFELGIGKTTLYNKINKYKISKKIPESRN